MTESYVPRMDWSHPGQADAIKLFKQQCDMYLAIKNIEEGRQVDHILLFMGTQGLQLYNSWGLLPDEQKKPTKVWEQFELQIKPKQNFRVARFFLQKFTQKEKESIDDFVSRLKLQAYKCDFRDDQELKDRILDQLIAGTSHTELQKKLLSKPKSLTLDQAIEQGSSYEASVTHMEELARVRGTANVPVHELRKSSNTCRNCGGHHSFKCRTKSLRASLVPSECR